MSYTPTEITSINALASRHLVLHHQPERTVTTMHPLIGYLRLAAGQELGQAPIQVLGETLPQSAARWCRWCGSLMACVSSGAVRGVAEKGSVLLEVAVPSLLIIPMDKQEGTGGSHHWNGPAQAIGHD